MRRAGTQLYQQGRYAAACAKYTAALECLPDDARLWCNRAAAHVMLDQLEAAISDCGKAAGLDPGLAKAYIRAARAYTGLGLVHRAKDLVATATSVASGSELDSVLAFKAHMDEFEELMTAANVALLSGEASRSLADAERALSLFPYDVTATLVKVKALVSLRRVRFVPEVCLEMLPPTLQGRNARCEFEAGPSEEQIQLAVEYAVASWCLEELDRTHAVLDAVLRVRPGHPLAAATRAMVARVERTKQAGNDAFRAGQYSSAVELYTAAVSALEGSANTRFRGVLYSNRAAALMGMSQWRSALADCTAALKLDTRHIKARLRRARCFVEVGEFDAAGRDFEQALGDMKATHASAEDISGVMVEKERAKLAKEAAQRREEWKRQEAEEAEEAARRERFRRRSTSGTSGSSSTSSSSGSRYSSSSSSGWHGSGHGHGHGRGRGPGGRRSSSSRSPEPQQRQPPPPPPPTRAVVVDHYEVLGVAQFTATAAQVRKAYHKMALQFHPDKVKGDTDRKQAEETFKQVAEAYRVLSDGTERAQFDRALREQQQKGSRRRWFGFRRAGTHGGRR